MRFQKSKGIEEGEGRSYESEFEAGVSNNSCISHENSACLKREKNDKLKKRKKRIYSTKAKGNWEHNEDMRFLIFMETNRESFENRELRRSNKIFKKMAKYVKSRCPEQCRSHHQKYEKKFHTFDNIVNSIREKIKSNAEKYSFINFEDHKLNGRARLKNRENEELPAESFHFQNQIKIKLEKDMGEILEATGDSLRFVKIHGDDQYNLLIATEIPLEIRLEINFENAESFI